MGRQLRLWYHRKSHLPIPPLPDFVPAPSTLGFILTRYWRDTSVGTEIEYWLATDAGPLKVESHRLPWRLNS